MSFETSEEEKKRWAELTAAEREYAQRRKAWAEKRVYWQPDERREAIKADKRERAVWIAAGRPVSQALPTVEGEGNARDVRAAVSTGVTGLRGPTPIVPDEDDGYLQETLFYLPDSPQTVTRDTSFAPSGERRMTSIEPQAMASTAAPSSSTALLATPGYTSPNQAGESRSHGCKVTFESVSSNAAATTTISGAAKSGDEHNTGDNGGSSRPKSLLPKRRRSSLAALNAEAEAFLGKDWTSKHKDSHKDHDDDDDQIVHGTNVLPPRSSKRRSSSLATLNAEAEAFLGKGWVSKEENPPQSSPPQRRRSLLSTLNAEAEAFLGNDWNKRNAARK